jgi:predicted secreted protein
MAMAGTGTLVKVSIVAGGAGAYNTVAEIKSATMNLGAGEIDVAAFGSVWEDMIQGLKSAAYSLGGFWKPGDADGQVAIRNQLISGDEIWVQFLPNGVAGFKQQVTCVKFDIGSEVNGAVELTIELRGKGAPVAV